MRTLSTALNGLVNKRSSALNTHLLVYFTATGFDARSVVTFSCIGFWFVSAHCTVENLLEWVTLGLDARVDVMS